MTTANRGKVAEGLLKKAFTKLASEHQDFCFERIEDARSSKGASSTPRAGDFVVYYRGKNFLIECKEVAHDFRLPKSNFKRDQRARMRVRELAGSICMVLIYHSTTGVWRLQGLDFFGTDETGSWDLRGTPEWTLPTIISEYMNVTS